MKQSKIYLGDAVYAELTDYSVRLTTEDGYRATNTIELEPEVLQAFIDWLKIVQRPTPKAEEVGTHTAFNCVPCGTLVCLRVAGSKTP